MTLRPNTDATEDAQEYTDALSQLFRGVGDTVEGGWRLIAAGIKQGIPKKLGMDNDAWAERLLPRQRYAIDQRRDMVAELAEDGFSQREIAAVLGVNAGTVNRDLSVANATPEEECISDDAGFEPVSVANATPNEPREFAAVDLATGEIVPLALAVEEQAGEESNEAVGAVLRAIEDEPDVVRARLRRMFSQGVAEMSSNVLVLDPEAVAEAIQPGRLPELRHFREALERWFGEFERATNRGVRAVK